jgi:crotonobetainyl-CoA:carnitine CoA-transferase CaiB-like acyl-CoA transferase
MTAPLEGVRVLDLSRVLAGPWATQTLADLGAEVIKIEKPGTGDDTRAWGPPWAKDTAGIPTKESAYFLSANRGKKSVTVDFTQPDGRRVIEALAKVSDIVVENYRVGALKKHGLDYESLTKINPHLIYCSISGFGQTGPKRDLAGYDFQIQGMGGLMSITGQPDGAPGAEPMKVGVAVADIFTGLYAAIAILAALNRRHATGKGDHIDLALLDVQIAVLANQASNYLISGRSPSRLGNAHPNIVPYQAFLTSDGHFILAVGNDQQFTAFCSIAGHPEWATDTRFATNPARVANRTALIELIRPVIKARPTKDWLETLGAAGIPVGPINTIEETFADEQVIARGMRVDLPHARAGTVPSVACPIKFRNANPGIIQGPPTLGEHTNDVLLNLIGLSHSDIADLQLKGAI